MKNVINITQCDNQLIIFAVSSDGMTAYEVARVGNGPAVDVSITLAKGVYSTPKPIINPLAPSSTTVDLPADTYRIYYTGFNLGGPYNFAFTLNNHSYDLKNDPSKPLFGFIWNLGGPTPSTIEVVIA